MDQGVDVYQRAEASRQVEMLPQIDLLLTKVADGLTFGAVVIQFLI
jgi:hypothetical protein